MKKATAIILGGIVLLFLFSLYAGSKLYTADERNLALNTKVDKSAPETEAAKKRAEFLKVRLAFGSFDLAAGLTPRDLEAISAQGMAFPFYFLLASLWLALGLRKPGRRHGGDEG